MESTKEKLLALLEENRGESLSGQELARRLGISRAAVWKAMERLKKEGHQIQGVNNKGYQLLEGSDVLTLASMEPWLPQGCDRSLIHVYDTVESTNITARELAAKGAPEGTAVVAARQEGGKGRRGRSFFSPKGGVYVSMVLRPQLPAEESARVTTTAAVQICRVLEEVCGFQAQIKWVNDVMLRGKKICGILTEGAIDLESGMPEYIIVGIGVNLLEGAEGFPPELRQIAGALYRENLPQGLTRGRFAAAMVEKMGAISALCTARETLEEYRRRCPLVGHRVMVMENEPWEGKVIAISDKCGLVVEKEDRTQRHLQSGEVSIRPGQEVWRKES